MKPDVVREISAVREGSGARLRVKMVGNGAAGALAVEPEPEVVLQFCVTVPPADVVVQVCVVVVMVVPTVEVQVCTVVDPVVDVVQELLLPVLVEGNPLGERIGASTMVVG